MKTKLLSILMFATLSFGVANFVFAETIAPGDTYNVNINQFVCPDLDTVRQNNYGMGFTHCIGSVCSPDGNWASASISLYYVINGCSNDYNFSFPDMPAGDYTSVRILNLASGLYADVLLPSPLHVGLPPRTATSTMLQITDPIITSSVGIMEWVFRFVFPFILILGIIAGLVKLFQGQITRLLLKSGNKLNEK